ncbi:NSS family neurotransmitter:Na+ symporter [Eilatimonas milleporae]|uniref:NSS family neurotransmitter:Na+ symporter n=1 Tax=Eilatimonas milleporae TaxID=911205 RepID=A0A3M0BYW8_9PROT|nr:sodium-dependent transporter [Eilatimonas milleporae]RMB02804.1 NSS family neurotransmitter:Na+ symporter [Eilatimonas milleporae]
MAVSTGHAHWSSRWTFLLAAVGSAVGLGNIWKFPYEAGQGGGGAFVLIYLAFVFLIGTPVLIAELSLGRRGQLSPVGSMREIAKAEGRSSWWQLVGWSGVIGAFIVISFYSVIGGWTLGYFFQAMGGFSGYDAAISGENFQSFISDPLLPLLTHAVFMAITVFIVARGVQKGLEKAVTTLMPALFVILVILVIYAGVAGNFSATIDFLFSPNFENLTPRRVVEALGLAFFSLSLALGSIMTYGSYLDRSINVTRSAITISAADSAVALMSGLAIFPIVFAFEGLAANQGPGLVFVTLPIAFGQMPLGVVFGTLFFGLLLVAAITSAISLLEPSVAYVEETGALSRRNAAILIGGGAFLLGILTAYSQGDSFLSDVRLFGFDLFGLKDYLTNNIMMPVAGMFTALFVGWFVARKSMLAELAMSVRAFRIWYFLVRFAAPVAILFVFLGLLFGDDFYNLLYSVDVLIGIVWFALAIASGRLAYIRDRSPAGWFLVGLVFPFAVLFVAVATHGTIERAQLREAHKALGEPEDRDEY